jgi:ligand-binding sensor domain-containing protein
MHQPHIVELIIDKDNNLLVGTWNGLYILKIDVLTGIVIYGNVPHHLMSSVVHA